MNVEPLVDKLVRWLRELTEDAGAGGLVFGLSGGVDSAVVGRLCRQAFREQHLALIMPLHSDPQDLEDARLVARTFDLRTQMVDLGPVYERLVEIVGESADPGGAPNLPLANIKPRLRMTTLYYHANKLDYLVCGTGNRSELMLGYFTKYGDGGVDLLPLGNLLKSDVREIAEHLDVPPRVLAKPPSAGIWRGHTDERELGFTYEELDAYLRTGEGSEEVARKVEGRRRANAHKLRTPKMPPSFSGA